MSSPSKQSRFSRPIFKRVLLSLLALFCCVSLLLALTTFLKVKAHHSEIRNELKGISEEVAELYLEQGLTALLEEYELDESPIFDNEEMLSRFEHDDLVFAFYDNESNLVTGAKELDIYRGFQRHRYFVDDERIRVIGYGSVLEDGAQLMLQMPIGDEAQTLKRQLVRSVFVLFLFVLLALPTITYVLSRWLINELTNLSLQIDGVAQKPDTNRLVVCSSSIEIKSLTVQLNQMLDKVATLHRQMLTMSVGIAHDLKTPLSRVANRIQLMQQDLDDKGAMIVHLEKADSDLQNIIKTFSNLIRLNEIESGRRKAGFKLVDVSSVISDLAESYLPVFEDSGKQLQVSVVDNVMCQGDIDLLNQMVSNLLENALVYSDEQAKVWIRLQSSVHGALLQIGDSGPGIDSQFASHIFERFYRADYSRGKPGNGLGLSIVKAICDLHEASITLIPNQSGAVFDILLPIQE